MTVYRGDFDLDLSQEGTPKYNELLHRVYKTMHALEREGRIALRVENEALEEAFGDSDEWAGHKVKIFCAPTTYQTKKVDGIRVEPIVPKPALKEELNDEVA